MAVELFPVEVDLAKVAVRVALGLVPEVLRTGVAAFSPRGHRSRAHTVFPELDHGDEAVPAGAVPFLRARVGLRGEAGEASDQAACKRDRKARLGVVERLLQVAREPLEPIDL